MVTSVCDICISIYFHCFFNLKNNLSLEIYSLDRHFRQSIISIDWSICISIKFQSIFSYVYCNHYFPVRQQDIVIFDPILLCSLYSLFSTMKNSLPLFIFFVSVCKGLHIDNDYGDEFVFICTIYQEI